MIQIASLSGDAKLSEILTQVFYVAESTAKEGGACPEWKYDGDAVHPQLFRALLLAYAQITSGEIRNPLFPIEPGIAAFGGCEDIQSAKVKNIELWLRTQPGYNPQLNSAITYLLDELICNIQQHSCCRQCLISADVNVANRSIDVCVSDNGISLYGSFVKSGRYKETLGNDSISALCMAKDGFSTKNRPDAENRGYGISSNIKMVINGLAGDFAIISGNALYLNNGLKQQLIGLPETIEWQGTTIIVRIPLELPKNFNLYDYIA